MSSSNCPFFSFFCYYWKKKIELRLTHKKWVHVFCIFKFVIIVIWAMDSSISRIAKIINISFTIVATIRNVSTPFCLKLVLYYQLLFFILLQSSSYIMAVYLRVSKVVKYIEHFILFDDASQIIFTKTRDKTRSMHLLSVYT